MVQVQARLGCGTEARWSRARCHLQTWTGRWKKKANVFGADSSRDVFQASRCRSRQLRTFSNGSRACEKRPGSCWSRRLKPHARWELVSTRHGRENLQRVRQDSWSRAHKRKTEEKAWRSCRKDRRGDCGSKDMKLTYSLRPTSSASSTRSLLRWARSQLFVFVADIVMSVFATGRAQKKCKAVCVEGNPKKNGE